MLEQKFNGKLDMNIEADREKLISDTQELIRINTVRSEAKGGAPFGKGIGLGLEKTLEIAESMGFNCKNLDGYIGYAEYGEGDDYIGVLAHIDVVPEGEGWKFPPYGAEVHHGRIYGRGAIDDKGPLMAALYALKSVKDSGISLKHRIRVIFGTDEEVSGQDIEYYKSKESAPVLGFAPDANFPVIYAEKGILNLRLVSFYDAGKENCLIELKGGTAVNSVPNYAEALIRSKDTSAFLEKVKCFSLLVDERLEAVCDGENLRIKAYGQSAHGSTPELGRNAIMTLVRLLCDTEILDVELKNYFSFINDRIGQDTTGIDLGIAAEDESGALSLNLGIATVAKGKACFELDIRYPVTQIFSNILSSLKGTMEKANFEIEGICNENPLYFSKNHQLVKALMDAYHEYTGSAEEPLAIGGGTYAKYMDNIVAFGPVYPGQLEVEHQSDEYIDIDQLIDIAKIYARAIVSLAR